MNALFRKGIICFLIIFPACFCLNFKQSEPAVKPHRLAGATALCCSSKLPSRYGIKFTTKEQVVGIQKGLAKAYSCNDTSIKAISFWFNTSYTLASNIKNTENSCLGQLAFGYIKDK